MEIQLGADTCINKLCDRNISILGIDQVALQDGISESLLDLPFPVLLGDVPMAITKKVVKERSSRLTDMPSCTVT